MNPQIPALLDLILSRCSNPSDIVEALRVAGVQI